MTTMKLRAGRRTLTKAERKDVRRFTDILMAPSETASSSDEAWDALTEGSPSTLPTSEPAPVAKDMRGRLADSESALRFILAGNATITLVSTKTETRYTYKIRRPTKDTPHFVSLLTGADNESDYKFMGTIFYETEYRPGWNSKIGEVAPSSMAWRHFWKFLIKGQISQYMEIWHEGSCGRCGRKLTDPASIADGFGPVCAGA